MNKRSFIPVLLVIAFASLAYAIYRSTGERITTIENGRQIVYGDPQHGLTLGLCVFAGLCVIGAVLLLLDKVTDVRSGQEQHTVVSKKIATNYPQ